MKLIPALLIIGFVITTTGCAHMPHSAAYHNPPGADTAKDSDMRHKHKLFADSKISAKKELATLLLMDLNDQQQESLADLWHPLHQHEAENTARLMELNAAIKELKAADKLDTDKIASLYGQIAEIKQKSAKDNAQTINAMRTTLPGEKGWSTRAAGPYPMMDNVLWCIEFCSGQADVLCFGGGDLKCWRKRFLQCAAMCYR